MQIGPLSSDQAIFAVGGSFLVLAAIGWGMYSHYRNRPTQEELERRRREMLHVIGKMGDCSILELQGSTAIYSYDVRGVEYTASQDLAALSSYLPPDPWVVIGPASVKYDPRNPANSIVLCENWTGLRKIS